MTYKKTQLFTYATALGIVKSAIRQITNTKSEKTDAIIFNSLNKAIEKKKQETKGAR